MGREEMPSPLLSQMIYRQMIYRGFDIKQTEHGWTISRGGEEVHTAKTEDAAYLWIDGFKATEHKKG
jgi:hypothetical protein